MKRTILFVLFVLLLAPVFVSCEKEDDPSKQIVGTWIYIDHPDNPVLTLEATITLVLSKNGTGSFDIVSSAGGLQYSESYEIIEWLLENSRLSLSLYDNKKHIVKDDEWRVVSLTKNAFKVFSDKYGEMDFTKK